MSPESESLQDVCVFCSSSDAVPTAYKKTAREFGAALARARLGLVWGGGQVGLMGAVARGAHDAGGLVIGVIPGYLRTQELAYEQADELIIAKDLRERKRIMEERSDGFVALPGGFGTLDEVMECITHRQLKRHDKPIVFLNQEGFFDPLLAQFERFYERGFSQRDGDRLYSVATEGGEALECLRQGASSASKDGR